MDTVSIAGLDKAEVLRALWEGSHPQGRSTPHEAYGTPSVEVFREALERNPEGYFDYLMGRVLKVDLTGDTLDTRLYDRDTYEGAAAFAVQRVRAG